MRKLGSKYVINVIDTIETEKEFVIVTEDCGATLFDIVATRGALSAGQMRDGAQQLFMAVAFLHVNHIFRGDLNLDNVAIGNDGDVKLIDFGLPDIIKESQTSRNVCGSPNYTAPEVLLRAPHDLKADIWALGITPCAMATGTFRFPAFPECLHRSCILSGPPDMDDLRNMHGDDLADLIMSMLTVNPDKRPTIRECLAHKWFHANPDQMHMWRTIVDSGCDRLTPEKATHCFTHSIRKSKSLNDPSIARQSNSGRKRARDRHSHQ